MNLCHVGRDKNSNRSAHFALIYTHLPQFTSQSNQYTTLNKTLTIDIHQDPTKHVDNFLQQWLQFGAYEQLSEVEYQLPLPQ